MVWRMIWKDIRFAVRVLRKAPMFTFAAVATLALSIGANTAIFSVVHTELLRLLPYPNSDRLVWVAERNDKLKLPTWSTSALNYLSFREQSRSFDQMGAIGYISINLTGRGDPEQFTGCTISPSIFPLLGISASHGRGFQEGEDKPGTPAVAMISEGLWKRRFASDPALIGGTIKLNDVPTTVVGIAPATLTIIAPGDVWIPLVINPPTEGRLNHTLNAVGRLKPGVTLDQAQAEMESVSANVVRQYPEITGWGVRMVSFRNWLVPPQLRTMLWMLMAAVTFVLLIACANIANLLSARGLARQREIAVRMALGANRGALALAIPHRERDPLAARRHGWNAAGLLGRQRHQSHAAARSAADSRNCARHSSAIVRAGDDVSHRRVVRNRAGLARRGNGTELPC